MMNCDTWAGLDEACAEIHVASGGAGVTGMCWVGSGSHGQPVLGLTGIETDRHLYGKVTPVWPELSVGAAPYCW